MSEPAAHSASGIAPRGRLFLAALGLLYSLYIIAQWNLGYIDFGDGNYMYIASRIAEGAIPYRDILAPQPPCHLFLGALIAGIARLSGAETPIYFFRGFSLLLHLFTMWQVAALARRAWGSGAAILFAPAIFMFLPIGCWWALGYQSEPLEIAFLLAMMQCALLNTRTANMCAGIFAGLAGLTNATAAPFLLVLIVYMLFRAPRRVPLMVFPCVILVALITVALETWTGGAYLQNVLFNQVGTYPRDRFFSYAWSKIIGQGGKVLFREGIFLALALAGLFRLLRDSPLDSIGRAGLGWFCAATLGSIIYVTKGGTADYIFSLSEPAVAILAAGELAAIGRKLTAPQVHRPLASVGALMLVLFAVIPGIDFHRMLWTQQAYELDEPQTMKLGYAIKKMSGTSDLILAPPFYAVLAGRRLLGDYSELFIWTMAYKNEHRDGRPAHGMGKVQELTAALNRQGAPLAMIEMDQTGTIPEIMLALRQHYRPIRIDHQQWVFFTLNTRLGCFVPVRPQDDPAQTQASWDEFRRALVATYGEDKTTMFFGSWLGPSK